MGRAPLQVLVIPFRQVEVSFEFCVLKRSDAGYWQFVAGGAEDFETQEQAAVRESREELGTSGKMLKLDSMCTVPANFFKAWSTWPKGTLVIPEYAFAIDLTGVEVKISREHSEFKWGDYETVLRLLHWQSNQNALWELKTRLAGN